MSHRGKGRQGLGRMVGFFARLGQWQSAPGTWQQGFLTGPVSQGLDQLPFLNSGSIQPRAPRPRAGGPVGLMSHGLGPLPHQGSGIWAQEPRTQEFWCGPILMAWVLFLSLAMGIGSWSYDGGREGQAGWGVMWLRFIATHGRWQLGLGTLAAETQVGPSHMAWVHFPACVVWIGPGSTGGWSSGWACVPWPGSLALPERCMSGMRQGHHAGPELHGLCPWP